MKKFIQISLASLSILFLVAVFPSVTSAVDIPSRDSLPQRDQLPKRSDFIRPSITLPEGIGRQASGERILKACQQRETEIKQKLANLSEKGSNMVLKLDLIELKIEDFYNSKVVPSGKTVSNFDALLADVQAKKQVVKDTLPAVQNDVASFSCSGDIKAQLAKVREDGNILKSALKDYKTSLQNLILAVKAVVDKESFQRPSGGPVQNWSGQYISGVPNQ